MSYAEHGPRIFLNDKSNSNQMLKYGEYIVPRKRSEGRLKLFESCTDLRAWSTNSLDNCRYFREIVENPLPQGKIVPYDVMIESLILLGTQTQTELGSLRHQLQKYKSLRLSPEQKKQLQDIDGYSLEDRNKIEDYTSLRESKFTDEENSIPKRSGTPEYSICSSSSNYESESIHRSRIDDESSLDSRFEMNKRVASSKTDSDEYVDVSEENRIRDDDDNHHAILIEKDSEIIALKNELAAQDVELEELKDLNKNLETMLKKKEATLDNLRGNLKISQQQMLALGDQLHQSIEESKKKHEDSKCLLDHLKSSLAEKSQECTACSREIKDLQKRIEDTEIIRDERNCLIRALEEMNEERMTLRELNREQAMHLADQDDEICRLLELLKIKAEEHGEREMRMKRTLDELRTEIQIKKSEISRFQSDCQVSSCKRLADVTSLSEMTNLDIRKIRCTLREDLNEVENEMKKRCMESQCKRRFREDETSSEATWNCDKELVEYTNEQLKTVQVSAWKAADEKQEDDEIYKQIVSQSSGSLEKIQQLIVELEPYQLERLALIEKISCLNESLEEARAIKDKKGCDEYEKVIPINEKTNKMIDIGNDCDKIIERNDREESARLDEEELERKIDEALVIHVKRSIERVERISLSLKGAGDNISRVMARKEIELEARNEEIAKLRVQVASRVSRGQGDHAAQQEHSNEMNRVKNELSTTQRSLQRTRDQLQSSDFKLKGANQRIKGLGVEINRLTKENKGLNNTVLITNDLAIKVDEMEIRLDSLQEENSELRQRVSRANKVCAEYQKKLIDLKDEGMQAKEAFERAESKFQSLLLGRDNKIHTLRDERDTVKRELQETNLKVAMLTEQVESLRMQNKNLDFLEALIKEILKLDKNAKKLRNNVEYMRSQLENQRQLNDKIEEDLNLILGENESLQKETRQLYEYIERDSMMPEALAQQTLGTLPNKVLDQFEASKVEINPSESLKSEINELRAKSLEDSSVIENLRCDIESWNNKVAEQEKLIIVLEEVNTDLRRRIEEIQRDRETVEQESSPGISAQEIIVKTKYLESEIKEKEERIEKLAREIEATKEECNDLREKVQLLTSEKTELSEKMRSEKLSWQRKMTELQQQYKQRVRSLHDQHNDSIKKLEAQYEEDIKSNGNPFDPETWLQSLTIKEMTELHKRICKSMPCDASKITRALNDKQNQQLQKDEKLLLHTDIVNLRTGHHKETTIGYPGYMYERRKFNKPTETSIKDNTMFDMQRINFIYQCAMEHNHDGGN